MSDDKFKEPAKICVMLSNILGAIAHNGIRANDFPDEFLPNYMLVLEKAKTEMYKTFTVSDGGGFVYRMFDEWKDVENYIHDLLYSIPEWCDWNLSKAEIAAGVLGVDDPNRSKFNFSGRGLTTKREDFFVGLDAFTRNVFYTVQKERLPVVCPDGLKVKPGQRLLEAYEIQEENKWGHLFGRRITHPKNIQGKNSKKGGNHRKGNTTPAND